MTAFEYDKAGRPVGTIDANGRISTRTYDSIGNLLALSQPKDVGGQLTTNFTYTARNEIASESDPADPLHRVDYSYDAEGRQRFRYDKYNGATERTVEQIYRDDGRITEKTASGGGLSTHRTTFGYDAAGNPTFANSYFDGSATANISSISAAYTTADELKTWTETIHPSSGAGVTKTSSFSYERDGLLTARTVDGNQTTYVHYGNAWEKNTSPWGGLGTLTNEYHANGALRKITLPNGTTIDQTFDAADRLSSRVVKKTDGSVLSAWENILYDESDNRVAEQVSQRQTDNTTVLTGAATYGYDRLDRLTSAKHPFEEETVPYTLDDAGNILTETDFAYSYSNNRLASRTPLTDEVATPFNYGYDHFGNQITETQGTQTTSTSYDAASYTKRVTSPDGSWVEYRYDGLDRMVRRQDSAGEVRLFFHDASSDQISLETDAAGAAKTHYLLHSSGDPLANDVPGTGRGYYVEDSRGDLTQLVDQSQNVKAVFGYDPFGKEKPALTNLASGWDSRRRFQGAPKDPKTGAYSLGPRMLSPQINRFVGADMYVAAAANLSLQADPLTGNRYLYAGANPAGMIDDGHAPRWLKKAWKWVKKNKWEIAAAVGTGVACAFTGGLGCIVAAGVIGGAANIGKYLTSGRKVTTGGAVKSFVGGFAAGAAGAAIGAGVGKVIGAAAKGAADDAASIISRTAQRQSARGVEGLRGFLSASERAAFEANPAGGSRFLGQAVHRATRDALDEAFPGRFIYRMRGVDFVDTWTEEMIELTTPGQVASHMARPGYRGASYATYRLPEGMTGRSEL